MSLRLAWIHSEFQINLGQNETLSQNNKEEMDKKRR